MDYLFIKFLHIVGVVAFMGGMMSTLALRLALQQDTAAAKLALILSQVYRLDRTVVFYGGLALVLGGLTAAMIPSTMIYHSFWVMAGFTIFLIQAGLFFVARRLTKKQQLLLAGSGELAPFWRQERCCRGLIAANICLGLAAIYFMVTKFTPQ